MSDFSLAHDLNADPNQVAHLAVDATVAGAVTLGATAGITMAYGGRLAATGIATGNVPTAGLGIAIVGFAAIKAIFAGWVLGNVVPAIKANNPNANPVSDPTYDPAFDPAYGLFYGTREPSWTALPPMFASFGLKPSEAVIDAPPAPRVRSINLGLPGIGPAGQGFAFSVHADGRITNVFGERVGQVQFPRPGEPDAAATGATASTGTAPDTGANAPDAGTQGP